jgi:hypothetical protein
MDGSARALAGSRDHDVSGLSQLKHSSWTPSFQNVNFWDFVLITRHGDGEKPSCNGVFLCFRKDLAAWSEYFNIIFSPACPFKEANGNSMLLEETCGRDLEVVLHLNYSRQKVSSAPKLKLAIVLSVRRRLTYS